jgi:FKBP-type peptidyl-prolyl cis-trans isomerase
VSKNLVIFTIICALSVGAILVYAKNNMTNDTSSPNQDVQSFNQPATEVSPGVLGTQSDFQNTQPSQAPQAGTNAQSSQTPPSSLPAYPDKNITQLLIKDEVVGTGNAVKSGDAVSVNYIGTFLDGKKFDSSYDRNQPFSFTVGGGQVIQGWDQGLVGMQVGGKRLLVIPSDLAYGSTGSEGAIPPNTPLMFEIQLLAIQPAQ